MTSQPARSSPADQPAVRGPSLDIAVLGAGYVGLVTAACLANLGHRVTAVEADPIRLSALTRGEVPFSEPGLDELVRKELRSGRLAVSGDPARSLAGREAVLVCVGTPLADDGSADLSQLRSACAAIAEHAREATIVVRSTLPPGVATSLRLWLRRADPRTIVLNPEFLRQGTAVSDFLSPLRVVIGTSDGEPGPGSRLVEQLYRRTPAPVLITDYASAELIKNAANAYLATRLAFINEVADLCEAYGADIDDVRRGLALDPRIGGSYLRPGVGFGGSCLPKELANLARLGREAGIELPMLEGAQADNAVRPRLAIDRLERLVGPMNGRLVTVLGLAFKAGTDDVRDSPALALIRELTERGALVRAHDPQVRAAVTARMRGVERCADPLDACRGADIVILATDWPAYRELDWEAVLEHVRRPVIFDTRAVLDGPALERAGWTLMRVGLAQRSRPRIQPRANAGPRHRAGRGRPARDGWRIAAGIGRGGLEP
ncbi:MAG: UDP-glucose/GDP-mannose dehydrogenase family protein [Chloroflexi bacterium]|nr:UDP-glucose/GDP-mannose dehydrogenase family protein [Chloroflexota bacterium]